MFELISNIFNLLTKNQRKRFYLLQILVVLMACAEIVGVASIVPFMSLVGDMSLLREQNFISEVYSLSGIEEERDFVFLLGIFVLLMLLVSAFISMFATWRLAMFSTRVGAEIADTLYSYYLQQNWLFHASTSSAQLTKSIANETTRVTASILMPLMLMNAKVVLVIFLSVSIFFYDPVVAILGIVIFIFAYLLMFKVVRTKLLNNGRAISNVLEQRFRLMNEGFGGIKDVLLLGRSSYFVDQFNKTGNILANSQGNNTVLAQVPRYLIELIAFGAMITLVLYLIVMYEGDLGVVLPILSVYALAVFKLLPAFQQIYSSMAKIKGGTAAFESIMEDLSNAKKLNGTMCSDRRTNSIQLHNSLKFNNVSFKYPGKTENAVDDVNISFSAREVIGIVGPSGSGKSTLIDILLGLIEPSTGEFTVDGTSITSLNRGEWQSAIGFVPQTIFLSEGTILENVAFGIPTELIDPVKVNRAIKLAHLEELVNELAYGIYTHVGERGIQLSGGQRQRIGIARALYNDADVLVFDEATSALDGITEKLIMDAIHDFSGKKTIVMIAHRLKTVKKCDRIYFIEKGKVSDSGTYQELVCKNQNFKRMAEHA